jgi:hypothetical protein
VETGQCLVDGLLHLFCVHLRVDCRSGSGPELRLPMAKGTWTGQFPMLGRISSLDLCCQMWMVKRSVVPWIGELN